jgi:predicted dehydrogenase
LATLEPVEPSHAGQDAGASVWWSWTAPKSGVFVFDTAGSEFDTVLAVYNGADVTSLVEVASNDDATGTDETSRVIFNAQAGTTYQVAVAGSGSETGSLLLNWRQDLTSVINIINQLLLD